MKQSQTNGIVWNEQSLAWFHAAGAYTDYNRKLAKLLLPHIPAESTVCDMGCGAGLVDLELAGSVREITCIDIDPAAVESIRVDAKRLGCTNLSAVCMDGRLAERHWDVVLALFHGGREEYLSYMKLADRTLLLVTHGGISQRFGPKHRRPEKCHGTEYTVQELERLGVRYRLEIQELEHGQPLKSLEDARKFVTVHSEPMEPEELEEYLKEYLIETEDAVYPYYLPKRKTIGIFVIRRDDQ